MIETRKQYERWKSLIAGPIGGEGPNSVMDWDAVETIEALREVVRRADEAWQAYELPDDVEQSLKDALDALPDWLFNE